VFNGVTITTLLYIIFCMAAYFLGQRTAVAKADEDRRRRFKTRCLSVFIWCASRVGHACAACSCLTLLVTCAGGSS
jgi:hypothetical protein